MSIYKYFLSYWAVIAVTVAGIVVAIIMHLNRMNSSTDNQLNYDQRSEGEAGAEFIRWDSFVRFHSHSIRTPDMDRF